MCETTIEELRPEDAEQLTAMLDDGVLRDGLGC